MQLTKLGLIATTSLSLGLIACGTDNIDQVRSDLANPTGLTADRDAVMAVQGQQSGSSPAMGLAAGGVPGQALTAYGKTRGIEQVAVRQWQTRGEQLFKAIAARKSGGQQNLRHDALVGTSCSNSAEANAAMEEIWKELVLDAAIGFGATTGDATYTVDVAACSNGELSGELAITLKIEIKDESVFFEVSQKMNLCETGGAMACVDGETTMRATAAETGPNASTAEVLAYWDVKASWQDNGATRSGQLKGGIRVGGSSSMGTDTAVIEYLFYIQTPDGQEYSYVWTLEASSSDSSSTVKWILRGADGSIECTASETMGDAMVTCTGSANFSYTEAEAEALENLWFGS